MFRGAAFSRICVRCRSPCFPLDLFSRYLHRKWHLCLLRNSVTAVETVQSRMFPYHGCTVRRIAFPCILFCLQRQVLRFPVPLKKAACFAANFCPGFFRQRLQTRVHAYSRTGFVLMYACTDALNPYPFFNSRAAAGSRSRQTRGHACFRRCTRCCSALSCSGLHFQSGKR